MTITSKLRKVFRIAMALALVTIAQPAFAIAQEGTHEPGEGLTALQTVGYFVLAPFGIFLTIVVVGYAAHRPKREKGHGNVLTEIK